MVYTGSGKQLLRLRLVVRALFVLWGTLRVLRCAFILVNENRTQTSWNHQETFSYSWKNWDFVVKAWKT